MSDETEPVTNTSDVIDSRDVIARIEYLKGEWTESTGDEPGDYSLTEDEAHELVALLELEDEASGYAPDWRYGVTLIRDSYFEDYARELAEDIGAIDRDAAWPLGHIDWPAAADQLRIDYTAVDFDGETYWIR